MGRALWCIEKLIKDGTSCNGSNTKISSSNFIKSVEWKSCFDNGEERDQFCRVAGIEGDTKEEADEENYFSRNAFRI